MCPGQAGAEGWAFEAARVRLCLHNRLGTMGAAVLSDTYGVDVATGPGPSGVPRAARWRVARFIAWTAVAGVAVGACGGTPVAPVASTATPSPTAGQSETPAPAAASPSATACTPLAAVESWPLAQRAAQLVVVPALDGQVAALSTAITQGAGGVLLLGSASSDLRTQIATASRSASLPLLVMADEEGGGVQRLGTLVRDLPWPRTMAQTMTPAAVESAAAQVGAQMKSLGVDVDLAPVLDLDSAAGPSDSDVVGMRSFSADATVAAAYGMAFVRGLQGAGVLAVVKHFPGLGGASGNTELGPSTTLPLSTLQQGALKPYQSAVSGGVGAVMVSHATVPGLTSGPASVSAAAITGLLRQQLGFHGLVMTDSLSAGAISAAGYTVPSAAVSAVAAGADMVLFGSTLNTAQRQLLAPSAVAESLAAIVNALVAAVQDGRLPSSRLDDAVLHVLSAKGVDPCAVH